MPGPILSRSSLGRAPLGLTPLRRSAAILKIGGYYYRYEDKYAILASPQDAEPSAAEDTKPRDTDISAMIEEIQADTVLGITGIRSAWTGLRTEASDGVPVVGFDEQPGLFWLAGQSGYGSQTSLGFARLAADLVLENRGQPASCGGPGAGPVTLILCVFQRFVC